LIVSVQSKQGLSLEEIRAFLKGSDEVHFEGQNRKEIYGWVNETLLKEPGASDEGEA
jgi:hypothetical protein